jgi:hypothetical protein
MTLEQAAYVAEIVGMIVVVVTLLYLAVQVRQGAKLMRSESRQAMLSVVSDQLLSYLDNTDLFDKLASEEKLSPADQLRFSSIWLVSMRLREHEWLRYKDGILDQKTWQSYRQIIRLTLSSTRHRQWWGEMKAVFDPDFVKAVDTFIADTPASDLWDRKLRGWDDADRR